MSHRSVGVAFCCISAFIFAIPYFSVAISFSDKWATSVYTRFFHEICGLPMAVSGCMLVVGIVYLCIAEKKMGKTTKK